MILPVRPHFIFDLLPKNKREACFKIPPPVRSSDSPSVLELCLILAVARIVGPKEVFEIGTYKGMTSRALWENYCGPPIHTLDLEPGISEELLGSTGVDRIKGHSMAFDFSPFIGTQSLVFIDGAHDSVTTRSDSQNALAMLVHNAAIIWHDYSPSWPGVMESCRAFEEEFGGPMYHVEDTSLCIYLRGEK
jgi:predicted O-methyltransferase YrrM